MTGHGSASAENEQVHVLAEIRAVNNRFLKITVSSDLDAQQQARIETMLREKVARGTVNVRLQLQPQQQESLYQINQAQLDYYLQNLTLDGDRPATDTVLLLPGVVTETSKESHIDSIWPAVEEAVKVALDHLCQMRAKEGEAMRKDLLTNCDQLANNANEIGKLAPQVADGYAKRITDRINRLLQEHDVSVTTADLVREVGVFAEKTDISEELVRLASHIEQFRDVANGEQSDGRKLDFLTQELLRETNTIGSKANDAQIANLVVEMKSVIERIREMTQNIE